MNIFLFLVVVKSFMCSLRFEQNFIPFFVIKVSFIITLVMRISMNKNIKNSMFTKNLH